MQMNAKNIVHAILGVAGVGLLVQMIRYNTCKSNVKNALLDPSLQSKYSGCTKDGFHKDEYSPQEYSVSATVSKFPFSIELTKWNKSTQIYWSDVNKK